MRRNPVSKIVEWQSGRPNLAGCCRGTVMVRIQLAQLGLVSIPEAVCHGLDVSGCIV